MGQPFPPPLCSRRQAPAPVPPGRHMQLARGEVVASATCGAACGACAVLWLLRPQRDRESSPARRAAPTNLEGIIEYNQLWVGADGSTQVAQGLSFSGLERKGYSGTPQVQPKPRRRLCASPTLRPPAQYVRQFGLSDFVVKSTIVTQSE